MAGAENVTLSDIENAVERGILRGITAVRNNVNEGKQSYLSEFFLPCFFSFVTLHMMNIHDVLANVYVRVVREWFGFTSTK